jgi:hypothetical protein
VRVYLFIVQVLNCENKIHWWVLLIDSLHLLKWFCEDTTKKFKVALESMQQVHDRVSITFYLMRPGDSLSWGAHLYCRLLVCHIVELASLWE